MVLLPLSFLLDNIFLSIGNYRADNIFTEPEEEHWRLYNVSLWVKTQANHLRVMRFGLRYDITKANIKGYKRTHKEDRNHIDDL